MKVRSKKEFLKIALPWAFAVGVFLFAAVMSSQSGDSSHDLSGSLSFLLFEELSGGIEWLRESPNWAVVLCIDTVLRKLAHILVFFLFTLFVILGLRGFTKSKPLIFASASLIALAAAVFDETVQSFVAGRNSTVTDVFIDMTGTVLALLCALAYLAVRACLSSLRE